MNDGEVAAVLHETMLVTLKLGGPVLLSALAVGIVMSLVQAVTQINEQTMALVPKIAVICGVLTLSGPFMLSTLNDYARMMFDRLIAVGAG